MPEINFNTFLSHKPNLVWERVAVRDPKIQGVVKHNVWQAFAVRDGKIVIRIPRYFASIFYDEDVDKVGMTLYANVMNLPRFDPKGRGQKLIDEFVVGSQSEVSGRLVLDAMRQRYGVVESDLTQVPTATQLGAGSWKQNKELEEKVMVKKTLWNKTDKLLAMVCLRKKTFERGPDKYFVWVLVMPMEMSLQEAEQRGNVKQQFTDIKDAMNDFHRTTRELGKVGFSDEVQAPEWATAENWDFSLDMPMASSNRIKQYLSSDDGEGEEFEPDLVTGSYNHATKTAQDVSGYYQGPIPDLDQLQQYVGTANADASQIKAIFGGVDDAMRLVNQFDSSLLTNVAFIYNFSGGGAYGVYMSALDEKIKNEKLKKMLKVDGYAIQDMPDGSFYATHPKKQKEQIDREITAYRQKIEQGGATTFGIDMNKVIGAAKSDANESGITDVNDQRWLGVLHLGATMVHEAVHSKGAHAEGPSEQAESKFMEWAMPLINQERRKIYAGQNKLESYSPLVVDPSKRRMASSPNWLHTAMSDAAPMVKQAQYGAQFLHNQNLVQRFGPTPWSSAFWTYGIGPIESMLDSVRPVNGSQSKLNFEGQLRERGQAKWDTAVDTSMHMEELLERSRDSLVAYKTTETLIEDSRDKPLMLPVPSMQRKASYDPDANSSVMQNLDVPMEDRVQQMDDDKDEQTDPNKNQPRYQPEDGNPMSSENGIHSKWVDLNTQIETFDDASEEHPNLKTSPWTRSAAAAGIGDSFTKLLAAALRGITSGSIRGTRFSVPTHCTPAFTEFFENDADIRIDSFGDEKVAKIWVVSDSVSKDSVEKAENYFTGKSEGDSDRMMFEYITGIPRIRNEAISYVIDRVRQAMRDAGVERILVVGDLPLAVRMGESWNSVRTVDFCGDDPDACAKIGEIVFEELGAKVRDNGRFLVANWKCVTFRFMCDHGQDERQLVPEGAKELSPVGMNLYGRMLTPLMLAIDVMTETVVDMTSEADPDVEAKVIRTVVPPENAIAANPLVIVDAIFLASEFGFSIDSAFADAAVNAEHYDVDVQALWSTIRASSKGKCLAVAEEYGLGDSLARMMGEQPCQFR